MPHPHDREDRPPRRTTRVGPGQTPPAQPPPRQSQNPAQLAVIRAQVEQLRAQNAASEQELNAKGIGYEQAPVIHARIDDLIDCIAEFAGPDGPMWAALVQLRWQQKVHDEFEKAQSQSTRMVLAQGSMLTPGQIAQLAAQSGMFGRRA